MVLQVIFVGWGVNYKSMELYPLGIGGFVLLLLGYCGVYSYHIRNEADTKVVCPETCEFDQRAVRKLLIQVRGTGGVVVKGLALCARPTAIALQVKSTGNQATIFAGFVFYNVVTFRTGDAP